MRLVRPRGFYTWDIDQLGTTLTHDTMELMEDSKPHEIAFAIVEFDGFAVVAVSLELGLRNANTSVAQELMPCSVGIIVWRTSVRAGSSSDGNCGLKFESKVGKDYARCQ